VSVTETGKKRKGLKDLLLIFLRRAIHRHVDVVIADAQSHNGALHVVSGRDAGDDHVTFPWADLSIESTNSGLTFREFSTTDVSVSLVRKGRS
jgi:hypothetical protein